MIFLDAGPGHAGLPGSGTRQSKLGEQPELVIVGVVGGDLPVPDGRDVGEAQVDRRAGGAYLPVRSCERPGVRADEAALDGNGVAGMMAVLDNRSRVGHRPSECFEILTEGGKAVDGAHPRIGRLEPFGEQRHRCVTRKA